MLRSFFVVLIAVACPQIVLAGQAEYQFSGHSKTRLLGESFPDDSVFKSLAGSSSLDFETDLRLKFEARSEPWAFEVAYQLFAAYGDRTEYSRTLAKLTGDKFRLPSHSRRLIDLTNVIRDDGKFAALHRLDRLSISHSSDKVVIRFGRQSITWGNGLFFSPMDIVNPFDPASIDTEYKPGDDMLYGQYLRNNNDDIQVAVVFRRNILTGDIDSNAGTVSIKYHGMHGEVEYDLLIADSFDSSIVGLGGSLGIGGAIWRGDLVVTDTRAGADAEFLTNLSYSWIWGSKNISGAIEYYFNGFGQRNGRYSPLDLAQNSELLRRVARGRTFSLGRHYIAGGLTIELTPLWQVTPNILVNMEDSSALLQIITRHNLADNLSFLGALTIPLGPDGTEYGGIPAGAANLFFSTNVSLFAQLAFYF